LIAKCRSIFFGTLFFSQAEDFESWREGRKGPSKSGCTNIKAVLISSLREVFLWFNRLEFWSQTQKLRVRVSRATLQ
jgi:hypothetical protein